MAWANVTIDGAEELIHKLEKLGGVRFSMIAQRKALRVASTPIVKAIREAAPVADPHYVQGQLANKRLRKSIGRKFKYYKNTGTDMVIVGPRIKGKWQGYHGHLVEFGTKPRHRKTADARTSRAASWVADRLGVHGGYTGVMPSRPFVGPVFKRMLPGAKGAIRNELRNAIMRAAQTR